MVPFLVSRKKGYLWTHTAAEELLDSTDNECVHVRGKIWVDWWTWFVLHAIELCQVIWFNYLELHVQMYRLRLNVQL